jgi:ABC-type transport system involved in Fe-S cluster assembly fused permease/ATPase subunit
LTVKILVGENSVGENPFGQNSVNQNSVGQNSIGQMYQKIKTAKSNIESRHFYISVPFYSIYQIFCLTVTFSLTGISF